MPLRKEESPALYPQISVLSLPRKNYIICSYHLPSVLNILVAWIMFSAYTDQPASLSIKTESRE